MLVVRYVSQRQKGVDTEELRVSTEQLKAELTRSADAVIARMSKHIQHLESLLRQADERNVRLEAGIDEYKRIAQELENRSAALHQELSEARSTIAELKACQSSVQSQAVVPPTQMPTVNPVPFVQQRVDAQDFATVLKNSMERDEEENRSLNAQQAAGLAEAMNRKPEEQEELMADEPEALAETEKEALGSKRAQVPEKAISPNAAKAKALLRSGYTVEETARETGMGRGAIELLREMNKHDFE